LLLALAAAANAQPAGPILHERVEFEPGGTLSVVGEPGEAATDTFAEDAPTADGPGVLAPAAEPGSERSTLDADTRGDDELTYEAVFVPSVAPFKRVVALDSVGADGSLGLADAALAPVPVIGAVPEPGRERFGATLHVRIEPGRPTRIPTVAAGARLLDVHGSPEVGVRFLRDSADALYATASEPALVTLDVQLDARLDYFGAPLPEAARLADIPDGLRPRVPAPIARRARRVLRAAGVARGEDRVAPLLRKLVGYFRGFSPGRVAPDRFRADPYLAISLSRTGVCRHRSHAFVVTAQSAGLPARYIHNEAHAFAEAYVPGRGWMRVDLGGAARSFTVRGAEGKELHRPAFQDPFPNPRGFRRSALAVVDGAAGPSGANALPPGVAAGDAAAGDPSADIGLAPTVVTVGVSRPRVRRGRAVRASGEVRTTAGLPVTRGEVILALYAPGGWQVVHVWEPTGTDGRGSFSARLSIPEELPPGVYQLVATYTDPGGPHAAGVSEPRVLRRDER